MISSNMDKAEIFNHNRTAWNKSVEESNRWTIPVSPKTISDARQGRYEIILTPTKAVPKSWFGSLTNKKILALAGAGGQQAPLLAAAGAQVTVVDLSPNQLEQDRKVADREGLDIEIINSTSP